MMASGKTWSHSCRVGLDTLNVESAASVSRLMASCPGALVELVPSSEGDFKCRAETSSTTRPISLIAHDESSVCFEEALLVECFA